MRFLKNKLAKARHQADHPPTLLAAEDTLSTNSRGDLTTEFHEGDEWVPDIKENSQRTDNLSKGKPRVRILSSDNIIKNYGRGMTSFALSTMAEPYLKDITRKYGVEMKAFLRFVRTKKKSANCIRKLREMLPIQSSVDRADYRIRLVFQEITIIFLKFFSVNWLYHSKIDGKLTHLQYRFKMLRRVRDPDNFTYLKEFNFM
jgi:hypothetical protein